MWVAEISVNYLTISRSHFLEFIEKGALLTQHYYFLITCKTGNYRERVKQHKYLHAHSKYVLDLSRNIKFCVAVCKIASVLLLVVSGIKMEIPDLKC